MREKGSLKIWGIVSVVVIALLLFAHYNSVNQIKSDYEVKLTELTNQIKALQVESDKNKMAIKVLNFKLKLEKIKISVSRNDFGTSTTGLNSFLEELTAAGCKKLEKLIPLFEIANKKLTKFDKTVLKDLDKIEKIIFDKD